MGFRSVPFPPETPLFPPANAVERYLGTYADQFKLREYIRLNTRVTSVAYDSALCKWTVETTTAAGSSSSPTNSETFDLLFICNGHHNVPRYPKIPGIAPWLSLGRAAHSVYYRNPHASPFALNGNHTVLVVGGGPSGLDITADVAKIVKRVIHSSSANLSSLSADEGNISRRGRLVRFLDEPLNKRVEFEDGSIEEGIDYCILATGYEVSFPFLSSSLVKEGIPPSVPPLPRDVWNTSYGVFPLAQYLTPFNIASEDPTLSNPPPTSIAFLGLLVRVVPMPLVELQARAALAAFANPGKVDWTREAVGVVQRYEEIKTKLPQKGKEGSGAVDEKAEEEKIHKAFFKFEPMEQFDYRDALADFVREVGLPSYPVLPTSTDAPESLSSSDSSIKLVGSEPWERELYARKDVLRRTWRALEESGEAESWLKGVGEGKSGKSVEEEWVELMWKVVAHGESLVIVKERRKRRNYELGSFG